MGDTLQTVESQRDEVHAAKIRKTKDQSIVISEFKTDISPIMGGLGEVKDISTPLTETKHPIFGAHMSESGESTQEH